MEEPRVPPHQEKILESLIQSVTDCIVVINRERRIIMANHLFMQRFGGQGEGLCYQAWKGRGAPCTDCLVAATFEDGQSREGLETLVMRDGKTLEMAIRTRPVRSDRGDVVYVIETATDLSRRKALEDDGANGHGTLRELVLERLRDLQKSEETYRTLFERSRDAILLTDPWGKILDINDAGVRLLGFRIKEDLLSLESSLGFFSDREELKRLQDQLFGKGAVSEFEARMQDGGGRSFVALITSNVILDHSGKISGYVLSLRDITHQKQIQEDIGKKNRRLAMLHAISMTVNSSLDLEEVIRTTIEKIIEIFEPDSVRIYLFDRQANLLKLVGHKGLSETFLEKPHVWTREVGDGFLGKTVQSQDIWVIDNLMRSHDPYVDHLLEEGFRSTVYMPLLSKGEAVGAMCVSSVTPFRFSSDYIAFLKAIAWQIGMAIHHARLYEELRRAYQDLKRAQDQVLQSEKLASLGKLSATIAHEINNPIASVLTYVRLMLKMMGRGTLTDARRDDIGRYLGTMESEVKRCGDIVKNLLTFSRQSELTIQDHAMEDVLERALGILAHDLEMKEIRVNRHIPRNLPRIPCDLRLLQQALINLISNASEAIGSRGAITIHCGPATKEGFLALSISDTGPGIPQEALPHIFEPFFTTKEDGKGVGLGLSVAYGIVGRHQGHIEVQSAPATGTTFTVLLPLERRPPLEGPSGTGGPRP